MSSTKKADFESFVIGVFAGVYISVFVFMLIIIDCSTVNKSYKRIISEKTISSNIK